MCQKSLAKKGFVEERGFIEIVLPFKEEVERRGWDKVCKQLESGRRALVKEFYANLGDRKKLTCYIRRRWVPFWGKGHLPTLRTHTSRRLHRVRPALEESQF